jgi:hypothetical protein
MARILYSALVAAIKGSISGSTFQQNRSGFIVRKKPTKTSSNSMKQLKYRQLFSTLLAEWRNLNTTFKNEWNFFASAHNKTNYWNASTILSGMNWFVSINSYRKALNLSSFGSPPAWEMPQVPGPFTLDINQSYLTINFNAVENHPLSYYFIFLSPPLKSTSALNRRFSNLVMILPPGSHQVVDVTSSYCEYYGIVWPPSGNPASFNVIASIAAVSNSSFLASAFNSNQAQNYIKSFNFIFHSNQAVLNTLTISVAGVVGKSITFNWGDTLSNTYTFTGSTQVITHSYSTTGTKVVDVLLNAAHLTYFQIANEPLIDILPDLSAHINLTAYIFNTNTLSATFLSRISFSKVLQFIIANNNFSAQTCPAINLPAATTISLVGAGLFGTIPDPSYSPNLTAYRMDGNHFTGSMPYFRYNPLLSICRIALNNLSGSMSTFEYNPLLTSFYGSQCGLSGTVPDLSVCAILSSFIADNNTFTDYSGSVIALTCVTFTLSFNNIGSAGINRILANFAANIASRPASGSINIQGGTNGPPVGQGIIDKATIIARGWTVNTN